MKAEDVPSLCFGVAQATLGTNRLSLHRTDVLVNNALADRIDAIDGLRTAYDVFHFTQDLGAQFEGYRFAIVVLDEQCTSIAQLAIVNNWEPGLLRAYDEERLAKGSPILEHMRHGVRPLRYAVDTLSTDRCPRKAATAAAMFNDFGMADSVCYPVCNRSGRRGGVVFSGTRLDISTDEIFALHLVSSYLFEHLTALVDYRRERRAPFALTTREADCLRWAALGKTTKETARGLDATDHTVAHHLATACRKLNAANRVHAVATALRQGFLD